MAYAINISKPLSIHVDSYGTVVDGFTDFNLRDIIKRNFDLRPGAIIKKLDLRRPIYKKTSAYGHFGRNDPDFTWEFPVDLSHELKGIKKEDKKLKK